MARINIDNFKELDKTKPKLQDAVKATYSKYEIDGDKYFHIDTYGNNNRKYPDIASQMIQLGEKEAKKLVELLVDYFKFSE